MQVPAGVVFHGHKKDDDLPTYYQPDIDHDSHTSDTQRYTDYLSSSTLSPIHIQQHTQSRMSVSVLPSALPDAVYYIPCTTSHSTTCQVQRRHQYHKALLPLPASFGPDVLPADDFRTPSSSIKWMRSSQYRFCRTTESGSGKREMEPEWYTSGKARDNQSHDQACIE